MGEALTLRRTPADAVAVARGGFPDLPPVPAPIRWGPKQKEAVVEAINAGRLERDQAMAAWSITPEELHSWMRHFAAHGRRGLAATRIQTWRRRRG